MAPPSATAPAAAATAGSAAAKRWIDGAGRDLTFYIATPLLLLPIVLLWASRPDVQTVLLYVGGIGGLGHHLPGMMRAYGDRALFARFRWRFILAPLFLVPVCVYFSLEGLGGIILLTFFWSSWHSLMQIFGFARIYDAKTGSTSRWTSRLDHALCLVWIGAPLLLSDSRLGYILGQWYGTGGPSISPAIIGALQSAWTAACVVVSAAWIAHTTLAWRSGRAPNPAKLGLFASSFLFWWFCMATVDNLLIGIALFDVFHDVQYLALVWTFNKSRVAADRGVGGFSRFLFRGRFTLAGVYVGMVVAYGSLAPLGDKIANDTFRQTLLGVLAASALLHFYFDGFIWKVREQSTRKALSMGGGGKDIRLGGSLPGWAAHGVKWLLFVVPLGAMYWWDVNDTRTERERREAVVACVPESGEALTRLLSVMDVREDPGKVLALHREAIAKKPSHYVSHHNHGVALQVVGKLSEAEGAFREAIRLKPDYAVAHRHLGSLLVARGQPEQAAPHFRTAIDNDPKDASALAGLAMIHSNRGEAKKAAALFRRALDLKPEQRTALNGLAWLHATHPSAALRDGPRAITYAEKLLEVSGRANPLVLDTVAAAYAEAGRFHEAKVTVREAIGRAKAAGQGQLVPALAARLRRYEQGQPWRAGTP